MFERNSWRTLQSCTQVRNVPLTIVLHHHLLPFPAFGSVKRTSIRFSCCKRAKACAVRFCRPSECPFDSPLTISPSDSKKKKSRSWPCRRFRFVAQLLVQSPALPVLVLSCHRCALCRKGSVLGRWLSRESTVLSVVAARQNVPTGPSNNEGDRPIA